jgi:hypothetical protein
MLRGACVPTVLVRTYVPRGDVSRHCVLGHEPERDSYRDGGGGYDEHHKRTAHDNRRGDHQVHFWLGVSLRRRA